MRQTTCQWGANRKNTMGGYRTGLSTSPQTSRLVVKKSPFQIAAKWLEIDGDVKRVRLVRHFLALNLCLEQW